ANLRAAGCPEQTIRDLIIADVDRSFRQRIAKLQVDAEPNKKYWQRPNFAAVFRGSAQAQQLKNEERETLRELLGAEAGKDLDELGGADTSSFYDEELGFLSRQKRVQLYELDR